MAEKMEPTCNMRVPAADTHGKDASARGAATGPEALGALCIPSWKDEGGGMKDEEEWRIARSSFHLPQAHVLHPSAFILHPSE